MIPKVHQKFLSLGKMLRRLLHGVQVMLTMDKVQAAILDWDYFDVVKGGVASMQMMKPVPNIFGSAAAYAETFKCLLLEELRASAQQVCIHSHGCCTACLQCTPRYHLLPIYLRAHCVWMSNNVSFSDLAIGLLRQSSCSPYFEVHESFKFRSECLLNLFS